MGLKIRGPLPFVYVFRIELRSTIPSIGLLADSMYNLPFFPLGMN